MYARVGVTLMPGLKLIGLGTRSMCLCTNLWSLLVLRDHRGSTLRNNTAYAGNGGAVYVLLVLPENECYPLPSKRIMTSHITSTGEYAIANKGPASSQVGWYERHRNDRC